MPLFSKFYDSNDLSDRLRKARAATCELLSDVIGEACPRFSSAGHIEKTARIKQLIDSRAWTDAALALIDLELPHWQVRRIAYDDGEWHCALSRERELPDWLDRSIDACHANLPLAILCAFVDAQHVVAPAIRTSVPIVPRDAIAFCEPVCCDNFG